MQTKIVPVCLSDVQSYLFDELNELEGVPYAVALLPVCILDNGLQIAKHPLSVIESVPGCIEFGGSFLFERLHMDGRYFCW